MSSFKIEPKIVHGISVDIPSSVHFLSNEEVIYSSGGLLTLYSTSDNSQKFLKIKTSPDKTVHLIIVHPKKSHIALSCSTTKAKIEIYNLSTFSLERTIPVPAPVTTMSYTWCGTHLVYVTSETDPVMYYFSFELDKVENSTLATQPPAYLGPVTMIATNTADAMIVVIVGNGLFRLLNLSDSIWRQYGFKKADQYDFVSVSWISAERVVAGTCDGRILFVDSGELKGIYKVYGADVINIASGKEQLQVMKMSNASSKGASTAPLQRSVLSVLGYSNGFVLTIAPDTAVVFEKESNTKYVKKFEFFSAGDPIKYVSSEESDRIFAIAISPNEQRLLCCTLRGMLMSSSLIRDKAANTNKLPFEPLALQLHYGEIKNLALCAWKPLMMTSGSIDRRVCLFNYEKNKLILCQKFNNDIHSLVMHPTGLFCIIAFTDVCQHAFIMLDKLELGKKISSNNEKEAYSPLRSCKVMEFSFYGTLLAVADGVQIKLYEYIQYHLLFTLSGHRIAISSFKWTSNDNVLLSCGLDGAVYMWNPKNGERKADIVTKNCQHLDIEASSRGDLVYTVGNDGHLREIKNEVVIQDLEVTSYSLSRIVMSRNDLMCVIADVRGLVYVVDYPFVQKVNYTKHCVHTAAVTQMKLTYDNTCLITCDNQGMMCFWQISSPDGVELTPPNNLYRCHEIFVSEEEIIELTTKLKDLTARINEIEYEHTFKLGELHKAFENKMTQMTRQTQGSLAVLKEKLINEEKKSEKEISKLNSVMKEMSENFEKEMDAVEKHLKYDLYVRECERSQQLEKDKKDAQESYRVEKLLMEQKHDKELEDMKRKFEKEYFDLQKKAAKLQKTLKQEIKNQEILRDLVEDGADRTILETQKVYENLIEEELKNYTKLKHSEGAMKEEIKGYTEEKEFAKATQAKLREHIDSIISQKVNADARIEELIKEIEERDRILEPREQRIQLMKTRADDYKQELGILKMRNEELQRDMKPKEELIDKLYSQLDMYKGFFSENELALERMDRKVQGMELGLRAKKAEKMANKKRLDETTDLLCSMQRDIYDLHEAMKDMNQVQLKDATIKLFQKYSGGKTVEEIQSEQHKLEEERLRQTERLQNIIKTLKRTLRRKRTLKPSSTTVDEHLLEKTFARSVFPPVKAIEKTMTYAQTRLCRKTLKDRHEVLAVVGREDSAVVEKKDDVAVEECFQVTSVDK